MEAMAILEEAGGVFGVLLQGFLTPMFWGFEEKRKANGESFRRMRRSMLTEEVTEAFAGLGATVSLN